MNNCSRAGVLGEMQDRCIGSNIARDLEIWKRHDEKKCDVLILAEEIGIVFFCIKLFHFQVRNVVVSS